MPRPTTALLVDDESHVRMYMRMLLQRMGVTTVWEAGDEASALGQFVTNKPEVIILDIVMPGKSGLDVLRHIRLMDPDIPVIVVTVQSSMGAVQEAHELGVMSYLLKHTPYDQMLKMLGDALDAAGELFDDEGGASAEEDGAARPRENP